MTSVVRVSILDLLRTGDFPALPFGTSRVEFTEKIGETDLFVFSSRRDRAPSLLRYGSVEFLITTDSNVLYGFLWEPIDDESPQGINRLEIDPWILRGGVSRETIEHALREENFHFTGQHRDDAIYSLSLGNGVAINFWAEGDGTNTNTICSVEALRPDVLPYREPQKQISVTLTKNEVDFLRKIAERHSISIAALCAEWIRHRLAVEADSSDTDAPDAAI